MVVLVPVTAGSKSLAAISSGTRAGALLPSASLHPGTGLLPSVAGLTPASAGSKTLSPA